MTREFDASRLVPIALFSTVLVLSLCWLGYALFAGGIVIVLSPLLLIGALVGGGEEPFAGVGGAVLRYSAACFVLGLVAIAATVGVARSLRTGSSLSAHGSQLALLAGVALGALLGYIGAEDVVSRIAPTRLLHHTPDPELAQPVPATDADRTSLARDVTPRAQAGDAYAQWWLGEAYRNGAMGVGPDATLAGSWIAKSAAQGDVDGALSLITGAIAWDLAEARDNALPPRLGQLPRLVAYAGSVDGWRRIAAQLMLAELTMATSSGGDVGDATHRQWLERAARGGSHVAAFRLARALEALRNADKAATPDVLQALAWYAWAGADVEMTRIIGTLPPAQQDEARQRIAALRQDVDAGLQGRLPAADEALLAKLARRATLVGARARQLHVVDVRIADAAAHAAVHAEASGDGPATVAAMHASR